MLVLHKAGIKELLLEIKRTPSTTKVHSSGRLWKGRWQQTAVVNGVLWGHHIHSRMFSGKEWNGTNSKEQEDIPLPGQWHEKCRGSKYYVRVPQGRQSIFRQNKNVRKIHQTDNWGFHWCTQFPKAQCKDFKTRSEVGDRIRKKNSVARILEIRVYVMGGWPSNSGLLGEITFFKKRSTSWD